MSDCSQAIYVKEGRLYFKSDKSKALAHVHGEHSALHKFCINPLCLCPSLHESDCHRKFHIECR